MRRPDRFHRRMAAREGLPGLVGYLLSPVGAAVSLAARARRVWYESSPRRSLKLPVPVISVGNIEMGGTGKTPVVEWLARRISGTGHSVAVVARNLGRLSDPVRVHPDMAARPGDLSDEVLLLAGKLLGRARVYAGKSKSDAAARAVMEGEPDVVILDDGFQHLRLHRDLDLVVVDFERPLGSGGVMPSGTLREHPSALSRADVLWVNRVERGMSAEWTRRRLADHNWRAPAVYSRILPAAVGLAGGGTAPDIRRARFLAFCGIGRPDSFRRTLREAGAETTGLVELPDHYEYRAGDLAELDRRRRESGADHLLTTEKDAVRLRDLLGADDVPFLRVELDVRGDVSELMDRVAALLGTEWRREDGSG